MSEKNFFEYGCSSNSNFKPKDTIGVPHPYCVTPKHLEYSEGMYLDIEGAEKRGAKCGMKDCNLTYEEHEIALIIECDVDVKEDDVARQELKEYLLKIKPLAERDKYTGFVFMLNGSE